MNIPAEQAPTFWGVVVLVVTHVFKWAQQARRDKRRFDERTRQMQMLTKELKEVRTEAMRAKEEAASAKRKLWRLLHPGEDTPDPTETTGVREVPKP